MFELIDLLDALKTEAIFWLIIAGFILPGAVLTAVLDLITPLDRGQLWAFSIAFSGVVLVSQVAALCLKDREDKIVLWYTLTVATVMVLAALLFFGFKVQWVGTFLGRFRLDPEMNIYDHWLPTAVKLVVTSVIALAGTSVVLLAGAASIALNRVQVWLLGLLLNVIAAFAIAWVGRRREWFRFKEEPDFPQLLSEAAIWGGLLVAVVNVASMLFGCFLYFGFRATFLAALFARLAPDWPEWLK